MPVELDLVVHIVRWNTSANATMEVILPSADVAMTAQIVFLEIVFLTSVLREKEEGVKRR